MIVVAFKTKQLDQLACDALGNRIDVRLDNDRPEEIGTRPLLVTALGVEVLAARKFKERLELL